MMPLKIEYSENEWGSYSVTLLGIGKLGKEAIEKYPCPTRDENHWEIQTLTLCNDDAFRRERNFKITPLNDDPYYFTKCQQEICEAIKNSDILFVIADISKNSDYENAVYFANLHQNTERELKCNILIDYSGSNDISEMTLESVFDLVVSHRSTSESYRPVEMLLHDMYTQLIGLDFTDVKAIIESTPKMSFFEEPVENLSKLSKAVFFFAEEIKKDKREEDVFNALLFFSIPHYCGLDLLGDTCEILRRSVVNVNMLVQAKFNADEDDESASISLMSGRMRIKDSAHLEGGECNIEDLLNDYGLESFFVK